MSEPFVSIKGLSHRYPQGSRAALENIDLDIPRGASFGLLGPNGAGKTTLLSLLTGLLPVQQGEIRIAGLNLRDHLARIKAFSGLVPQDYAFYPALTGRENLHFFADVYGLTSQQWQQRLAYCVEVCRLEEVLEQRAGEYSGGIKRRLNLAIGLLNAPQILYLDEPTVGIDARSRQLIVTAIQALRREGTTLIYTSHYMEEIEAICDELAIVDHGRVVARATTAQLLQDRDSKQVTIKLAAPLPPAASQSLAAWQPTHDEPLQLSLSLHDSAQLREMLDVLAQHGVEIQQLQFGVKRLEQIYLRLLEGAQ